MLSYWSLLNRRRVQLITKQHKSGLLPTEIRELQTLQDTARKRAARVAPRLRRQA